MPSLPEVLDGTKTVWLVGGSVERTLSSSLRWIDASASARVGPMFRRAIGRWVASAARTKRKAATRGKICEEKSNAATSNEETMAVPE